MATVSAFAMTKALSGETSKLSKGQKKRMKNNARPYPEKASSKNKLTFKDIDKNKDIRNKESKIDESINKKASVKNSKKRKLSPDTQKSGESLKKFKPEDLIVEFHEPLKKKKESVKQKFPDKPPQPAIAEFDIEQADFVNGDSRTIGESLFNKIIKPTSNATFFTDYFEKKPLFIERGEPDFYEEWFSCSELDCILREYSLHYTRNLDVTTYENGQRETHNGEGRAYAAGVWDAFQRGCSIRLLNPQTYSEVVWAYLSLLQEYFHCFVGANVYLTPAGTQGFAPHYDDIDAFVMQLEGEKHWKVYAPRNENETLPRFSSPNFGPSDVKKPLLEVTLKAGDLLYMPRGFIHQASTGPDQHSLHITMSVNQSNTFGDLIAKSISTSLKSLMEKEVAFRSTLPAGYQSFMGSPFAKAKDSTKDLMTTARRTDFVRRTRALLHRLADSFDVDAAADEMGRRLLHDALPPYFVTDEVTRSVIEHGEHWDEAQQRVRSAVELRPDSRVKLVRYGALRFAKEDGEYRMYYCTENEREWHKAESMYLEIDEALAPGIDHLIRVYPAFTTVEKLPLPKLDDQLQLATSLYEKGLIITDEPLPSVDSESSDDEEGDDDEFDSEDYDDESHVKSAKAPVKPKTTKAAKTNPPLTNGKFGKEVPPPALNSSGTGDDDEDEDSDDEAPVLVDQKTVNAKAVNAKTVNAKAVKAKAVNGKAGNAKTDEDDKESDDEESDDDEDMDDDDESDEDDETTSSRPLLALAKKGGSATKPKVNGVDDSESDEDEIDEKMMAKFKEALSDDADDDDDDDEDDDEDDDDDDDDTD